MPEAEAAPSLRRRSISDADAGPPTLSMMNKHKFNAASKMQGMSAEDKPKDDIEGIKHIIFGSYICILLLLAPVGIISGIFELGTQLTFWANFVAMIPLAKVLGDATEELALNLKNDMLSGLLNATFGNAVEMIVTLAMLKSHQYNTVKNTLLGSVLSNMLLVLGMSFTAGGLTASVMKGPAKGTDSKTEPLMDNKPSETIEGKEQTYNIMGALSNTSMLLLSGMILCLMTVYTAVIPGAAGNVLPISRMCSVFILISYVAYIIFQLFTHREAMNDAADAEEGGGDAGENEEEEEEPNLSMKASIGLLVTATCIVAVCSEYLTGSLEGAVSEGVGGVHISKAFLGIVLLPIVGNACEHAAAIRFAIQDKVGLSVGIAIGSSVQIALFVTPFAVLAGWCMGDGDKGENMNLDFGKLNVAVLVMSVVVIMSMVVDGKSNWLEGWMLMTAYAMVAIIYWFVEETA